MSEERQTRRERWTVAYLSAAVPSRPKSLLACAGMAALFHCAVFAAPWEAGSVPLEMSQEQSVEIELEPLALPREEPLPMPEPPAPPPAEPEPEPEVPAPPPPEPEPEPEPEPAPPEPAPVVKKEAPKPEEKKRPVERRAKPAARRQEAPGPVVPPSVRRSVQPARAVVSAPEPLPAFKNRKPVYPKLARQRGQEGIVLLRVSINAGGEVVGVDVAKSSGHNLLDDAAVKSIRRWRFKPAEQGGTAVAGTVMVPVEFRLK